LLNWSNLPVGVTTRPPFRCLPISRALELQIKLGQTRWIANISDYNFYGAILQIIPLSMSILERKLVNITTKIFSRFGCSAHKPSFFRHFFSFLRPLLPTEFHPFLMLTITDKDIVHLGIKLHKNMRNKVVHMFSKISIS
jgi:hypothetical protein